MTLGLGALMTIEEDPEQARAGRIPGPPQEVAIRSDDKGTATAAEEHTV